MSTSRVGDALLDECLHFDQITLRLFPERSIPSELRTQLHARDGCLQVMRNRGQKSRALGMVMGHAALHGVEGCGDARNLDGPLREQRRPGALGVDRLGGFHEAAEGMRRVPQCVVGRAQHDDQLQQQGNVQEAGQPGLQRPQLDRQPGAVRQAQLHGPLARLAPVVHRQSALRPERLLQPPGNLLRRPGVVEGAGVVDAQAVAIVAARQPRQPHCALIGRQALEHRDGGSHVGAGIGNPASEVRQAGILDQGGRRKVEQPGGDHAAAAPDLRNVWQVEIVLIVFRITKGCRLRIDRTRVSVKATTSTAATRPVSVRGHKRSRSAARPVARVMPERGLPSRWRTSRSPHCERS